MGVPFIRLCIILVNIQLHLICLYPCIQFEICTGCYCSMILPERLYFNNFSLGLASELQGGLQTLWIIKHISLGGCDFDGNLPITNQINLLLFDFDILAVHYWIINEGAVFYSLHILNWRIPITLKKKNLSTKKLKKSLLILGAIIQMSLINCARVGAPI